MQTYSPNKQEFMAGFKRHEPVIMDSTAMMAYKTCPLKYFYRIVLGFTPKNTPPYFAWGTAYHKFREVLEREARTQSEQQAFLTATDVALKLYKSGPQPESTGQWAFMTSDRLEQSCIVAFKHWLKERIDGNIKVIAYEQPFTLQLDDGTWVAGRADNIVDWRREIWGRDFKTSSKQGPYYSRTLEPNDQFTRYTWAEGKLSGTEVKGQIVEVLYNTTKEGPQIIVYTTTRTKGQITRWTKEHTFWTEMINRSRELDMYPMNEKSCTFCEYHSVCKAPSESGQMSQLKTYFKIEPWDCTATTAEE